VHLVAAKTKRVRENSISHFTHAAASPARESRIRPHVPDTFHFPRLLTKTTPIDPLGPQVPQSHSLLNHLPFCYSHPFYFFLSLFASGCSVNVYKPWSLYHFGNYQFRPVLCSHLSSESCLGSVRLKGFYCLTLPFSTLVSNSDSLNTYIGKRPARCCTFLHHKRRTGTLSSALTLPKSTRAYHFVSLLPPFLTFYHPGHLTMGHKSALKALEASVVEACANHEPVRGPGELGLRMRVHQDEVLREIWRSRCSMA
jgi:hypothetical protein